ncbi:hypothetical protein Prum_022540 [Phytohabitans rumicis]|uniref:Uncharacterized protein n=1 Tax=Phytohabitans rumicis TaxID=1076125 RepID=A0A6V8KU54_9ACTN|nr:hypothetical protein Prum_022540 [Phytohabitans rumicis]
MRKLAKVADDGTEALLRGCQTEGNAVTDATPSVNDPAATTPTEATCQHCGLSLALDDIWGWVHKNGQYLCYDPNTGEPMSLPAQPAYV